MVSTQQERIFCNSAATILFRVTHKPAQFVTDGTSYFELLGALRFSTSRLPAWGQIAALVLSLLNLLTEQIIRVYAWRRQAELLWRARRSVFGMLLLTNNGELLILVQLLLLGSLWLIILKLQATKRFPTTSFASRTTTCSGD
jgi:hypothetical protein